MTILEQITNYKMQEVSERKELVPVKLLEKSIYYNSPTVSLKDYINRADKSGIIAEFKRRSPSKGFINEYANPEKVSIGYMQAGASALSVLTDEKFFGGSNKDLSIVRKFNYCPILRKDFIIDEYQIIEAKSIGADAILLIAAILSPAQLIEYDKFAHSLGLEVLFEVHDNEDLRKIELGNKIIGVNNRNLKTFETNIQTSIALSEMIPSDCLKVSESGIDSVESIIELKKFGFKGFLIGETFMKTSNPENTCKEFILKMKKVSRNKIN